MTGSYKQCPRCGMTAPRDASQCSQCGRVYQTTAPQAPTILGWQQDQPTYQPVPTRRAPRWLWLAVPLLLLIFVPCLITPLLVLRHGPPPPEPEAPMKIHRSEIISYDPAAQVVRVKCPTCGGTGWRTNLGLRDYRRPRVPCDDCQQRGTMDVRVPGGLQIIPEGQPY